MPHPQSTPMHKNYLAALQRITGLGPGGAAATEGAWLLMDAGLEFDYFNIAARLDKPDGSQPSLDVPLGWFGERKRPFRLILRDDRDSELIRIAREHGFADDANEPAMFLKRLDAFRSVRATAGLAVRRVTRTREVPAYAAVEPAESGSIALREAISRRALTLDSCMLFLGHANGVPAARSMVLVTGRMAGIYNVFVSEEHRGRGFGRAITAAALGAALAAGATEACLSATDLGYPLYQRMGFETVFRYLSLWRQAG